MSKEAIRTAVGILGNVIACGLFLSPAPTFHKIVKNKTVEQFSAVPYLATFLNCIFWVFYGLPMMQPHSLLVLTINGAGLLIEGLYLVIFLLYSNGSKRRHTSLILLVEIVFFATVALVVLTLEHRQKQRASIIGIFCAIFGTMMYVAPLSVMKLVIQTKSVEYMPFFLSLASLLNGVCWTIYALIHLDLYIIIPNALGVLFAIAQLVLHLLYHKSTMEQIEERERMKRTGLLQLPGVGVTNRISQVHQDGHSHDTTENGRDLNTHSHNPMEVKISM